MGTCVHIQHTHTHANTQTWGNCPGDGIHRRLQIRSVGFPLTFSKTCKKCPFHYWLNNVIWAPTGPNRSRQRQSSTHMLRINQITEGRVGERKSERKRGRKRDTARHLEDWQYSLFLLPPPLPSLLLPFTFLTPPTAPPPSGICFRFEPVLEPYLYLISASRQKTESSMFPCIRFPAPDTPLENLTAPQNGWAGK